MRSPTAARCRSFTVSGLATLLGVEACDICHLGIGERGDDPWHHGGHHRVPGCVDIGEIKIRHNLIPPARNLMPPSKLKSTSGRRCLLFATKEREVPVSPLQVSLSMSTFSG